MVLSFTNLNRFFVCSCSQLKQLSSVGSPSASNEDSFGVLHQLEIGEQVRYMNLCVNYSGTNAQSMFFPMIYVYLFFCLSCMCTCDMLWRKLGQIQIGEHVG